MENAGFGLNQQQGLDSTSNKVWTQPETRFGLNQQQNLDSASNKLWT
jgi:hypothetical protein